MVDQEERDKMTNNDLQKHDTEKLKIEQHEHH